jgi:hypothetical protein
MSQENNSIVFQEKIYLFIFHLPAYLAGNGYFVFSNNEVHGIRLENKLHAE